MAYKDARKKQEYDKKYYRKNSVAVRDRVGKNQKKYYQGLVLAAQSGYGGKCLFCGEDRPETLVFHHVNGGGAEHRKKAGGSAGFQKWLIENNFPDDIVLLCANCHLILHRVRKSDE